MYNAAEFTSSVVGIVRLPKELLSVWLTRMGANMTNSAIESLVEQAKQGDKQALDGLIRGVQDQIYGLAIRMLCHPADAEDATQEILVKVVTHLSDFRHESAFRTWVYRIASNHLVTTHKRRAERREITFEECEAAVDAGLSAQWSDSRLEAEQSLVVQEVMMTCAHVLLLCLDRDLRLAYILGECLDVTSEQGGFILNTTSTAFRKRRSRARKLFQDFMRRNCGLIDASNPCRCAQQVPYSVKTRLIDPDKLPFARHPRRDPGEFLTTEQLQQMREIQRVAAFFRSLPQYIAPDKFAKSLKNVIDSGDVDMTS